MSYSTSNPPALVAARVGSGPALWIYSSADQEADLDAAGYISNAGDLGMQVGDFVLVRDTTGNLAHLTHVKTISSGAGSLFEMTAFTG